MALHKRPISTGLANEEAHFARDNWRDLATHFLIITVITLIVWAACSVLEIIVELASEWLYSPFMHPMAFTEAEGTPSKAEFLLHHAEQNWSFMLKDILHPVSSAITVLFIVMMVGAIIRGFMLRFSYWQEGVGDPISDTVHYFHEVNERYRTQPQEYDRGMYPLSTFARAFKRIVMTILTIGTGGSGGLEGPVVQIGESLASGMAKLFKIKAVHNLQVYQMAGIAAAITTLLNAPFTAAIFASEIILSNRMIYRMMLYALFAAVLVYSLNTNFFDASRIFRIDHHAPIYSYSEYLQVILVAVFFSAPAGLGVAFAFRKLKQLFGFLPLLLRAPTGMLLTFGIAYGLWAWLGLSPHHVLGMGEVSIQQVLNGHGGPLLSVWWVLLLLVGAKILTTGLTLMSGGSAGMLIPAMFMGGMTGAGVYQILVQVGLAHATVGPDLYVVAGIACGLVAIVEVPLSAIALVLEAFGANFGPPAIIAVVICYKLAKRFNVYE
ncbi:MAG: hypothetical protein Tsb005_07980 [Gammaproteobacteria bacterium]